jgi:hypothetical protein
VVERQGCRREWIGKIEPVSWTPAGSRLGLIIGCASWEECGKRWICVPVAGSRRVSSGSDFHLSVGWIDWS